MPHTAKIGLLTRFARDERGAFAMMFAVMAIVLVALGGAVVDYVSLEQTRNRAQVALDAAALALQPRIFESDYDDDVIAGLAEDLVVERIGNSQITAEITNVEAVVDDGSLYLQARVRMPTTFVSLVGVTSIAADLEAEATRKKLALEVVMVLDNSGSMASYNRMNFLKSAARCATNTLFYDEVSTDPFDSSSCVPASGAERVENAKMGVVPFTMFVNVGPGNASKNWMAKTNAPSISDDNFDNDDREDILDTSAPNYTQPSRFELFSATGESWRGCVEARPHTRSGPEDTDYLDTNDTAPTSGDSLFVPMFSPDMASGTGGNNYLNDSPSICDRPAYTRAGQSTKCTRTQVYRNCNSSMSNWSCYMAEDGSTPSGPVNFISNSKYSAAFYGEHARSCSCRSWTNWTGFSQTGGSGNNRTFQRTQECVGGGYVPEGLSTRELQERVCKYYAGVSGTNFSYGPNADCVRTPIQKLVDDPSPVLSTISAMQAEGGTNIHTGTVWGFRALSPGEPFAEGAPYEEATSKVLIIMTDGENTAYNLSTHCNNAMRDLNGSCYNSAYGFPNNSRNTTPTSTSGGNIERLGYLGANNPTLVSGMNERTSQTCANAKAAGITVYTIGLSTSNVEQSTPDVVREMLRTCASGASNAYFPENPSELKEVFASIANELSALRLAR